jgi:hypothetical protein
VLLGDWTPVVRDPVDLVRLSFVVGLPIAAVTATGSWKSLAVSTVAVLVVRPLNLPQPYDLSFCVALALTGWGDALGLYDRFGFYDNIVHFLVPMFFAPVLYIVLVRLDVLPELRERHERHHRIGIFVVTFALGLAVGAVWEIFEWTSDRLFGSHLVHGAGDTASDLISDAGGAALGGALLVVWSVYAWATARRVSP